MRKIIIISLVAVLCVLIFVNVVYGVLGNKTIMVTYRNISIYVNGQKVTPEVEPFIYNSRTVVPLRFISEALNKEVKWDSTNNRIDINDKTQSSGEWKKVIEFKGGDSVKTQPFTIHSKTWKIVFSAKEGLYGGGLFGFFVYSTDDPDLFIESAMGSFKNGTLSNETYIKIGEKNYFLDITAANCEYTITVYEQ
ncbi:MAG: copper amine oxidase N-terminal domain-containing protein [Caldisericum sp.]|uniref:copper amine oxidase N-terminal domain-containing protein n=1 Tax=Caldisericum sp. TaxID=2499687 RepID=UPI003D0B315A